MVRNTPTGCGKNLPILLRSNIFAKIEKCKLFCFGPIFDFFRNLGTREVRTNFVRTDFRLFPNLWRDLVSFAKLLTGFSVIRRIIDRILCHSPSYWPDLVSCAELLTGFNVIRRFFYRISCHSPNYWPDLVSFAEFLTGFGVIRRIFERIWSGRLASWQAGYLAGWQAGRLAGLGSTGLYG